MGCFICRPMTQVTDDPGILTHTRVGPVGVTYNCLGYDMPSRNSVYNGIMYIKGNRLCYENSFYDETLCCECTRRSWKLSGIKGVELVENETVEITVKYATYTIPMRPGLMITLENCFVMYVSMPDAVNFSMKLI